jgi:hypothetical protein
MNDESFLSVVFFKRHWGGRAGDQFTVSTSVRHPLSLPHIHDTSQPIFPLSEPGTSALGRESRRDQFTVSNVGRHRFLCPIYMTPANP